MGYTGTSWAVPLSLGSLPVVFPGHASGTRSSVGSLWCRAYEKALVGVEMATRPASHNGWYASDRSLVHPVWPKHRTIVIYLP